MNFLFKNLLAARGPDESIWVQIIIVAVIIGVGIIKAIIRNAKTMVEQKSDESEDEPTPISDKPKKRYVDADGSFKTLEQLREERIKQIRAAYGIPEPPIQKEPQPIAAEELMQPDVEEPQYIPSPASPPPLPTERPIHHPKHKKPVMHTAPAAAPSKTFAEKGKAHVPVPQPAGESINKLLFSSPDDLRNAILYQEIIGKPLALRES
ncbi:MAG: hypothetical protein ABSE89_03960 [Sedimentisphaerales bacterium]